MPYLCTSAPSGYRTVLIHVVSNCRKENHHPLVPPLDGTSGKHLLAQVVLVLANRAVPRLDRLVLAHQNLLCNLVQQSVRRAFCQHI